MREIDTIIVHCSATPQDMDIGVEEVRVWHVDGNGWSDVGYHDIIRRDGTREHGRPIWKPGAHAKGYNATSIGICLVGGTDADDKLKAESNFTFEQYATLWQTAQEYCHTYPIKRIIGHNVVANKACPCFDVGAFFRTMLAPTPGQQHDRE